MLKSSGLLFFMSGVRRLSWRLLCHLPLFCLPGTRMNKILTLFVNEDSPKSNMQVQIVSQP